MRRDNKPKDNKLRGDKPRDDKESLGLFEPLMVSDGSSFRADLNDLALELAKKSAAFRSSLPGPIASELARLVRSMNCYYSNLIEGHNTHPIDIERALRGDYSTDIKKRNLQIEAKAHIETQKWIDEGGLSDVPSSPVMIQEIHRRFYNLLPKEFLFVEDKEKAEVFPIEPGVFRKRDVIVGEHIAISPGAVPRFLERFDQAYRHRGRIESILVAGCAHHRLLWIHPFLDGNGRVARLMSYAMLLNALDTGGLWSVARGLARNDLDYKKYLQACDGLRRGNYDGRGTLSETALANFVKFFLEVCIDQISFMESLMDPSKLQDRIMIWAEEEMRGGRLPLKSDLVLRRILHQGQLGRGQVSEIVGLSERSARRITSALIKSGALKSETSRAPLCIAFPTKLAERWLPGLFPL